MKIDLKKVEAIKEVAQFWGDERFWRVLQETYDPELTWQEVRSKIIYQPIIYQ